ncbi:hypothetical protein MPSYJ_04030 [Mycolicibacterium psychrotolerans]|uniref:Uncharacterized protein n=1 Tax=Mycolicibacterium psychrotolerans TaxID=216929 RepID=A0A7I7M512_9MYCO|nr:hypothetical protein MPSYJ_04030 [Mycolicibacterium psychrotolerans]
MVPGSRRYDGCKFIIRLADNQRLSYATGSALHIGSTGNITATDPAGHIYDLPRDHWLDVSFGDDRVVTNRSRSKRAR